MNIQLCLFAAAGTHLVKQKMTKTLPRFKGDSLPGTVVEHRRDTEPTAETDFADFVIAFCDYVTSLLGL
jgi:hypothetical protein